MFRLRHPSFLASLPKPAVSSAPTLPAANLLANWKADAISASNDDPLDSWADSSGNGWTALQTTPAAKPIYKTGVVNSLPAVRFDTQYFSAPSLFGSATAAEIYGLVKLDADPPASGPNTGLWNFGGSTAERTHFPWTDGTVYDNFCTNSRKTTVDPVTALSGWNIYSARSASGDWQSYLNGVQIYSTTSNTFDSAAYDGNFIGMSLSWTATSYYLAGYIAEIAIYGAALSSEQQAQVIAYFKAKYGLP